MERVTNNNNSESKYIIMEDLKISVGNKYSLIKKIGKGSFGEVFLVIDKKGNEFACKAESSSGKNRLKGESNIYKRFSMKKLDCVPIVHEYLETTKNNLLVMQLLGKSLDVVFEEQNNRLDTGTVMKLAITIINHLEKIHRTGIIHRDIKPNNFMFGTGQDGNNLYVMDFGLSKKWCNDGNHIDFKTGRSMIGTARYASLNIHLGTEPSRRDDMESVGYMLLYLINGSLPWQGLKRKTKDNPMDKIGEKKMMVDLKVLCQGLPECFYEYINYTRNLQFTEKPDYDYLRDLFVNSASSNGVELRYFWESLNSSNHSNPPINQDSGPGSSVNTPILRSESKPMVSVQKSTTRGTNTNININTNTNANTNTNINTCIHDKEKERERKRENLKTKDVIMSGHRRDPFAKGMRKPPL
jgi:serine/threonine protein kinase